MGDVTKRGDDVAERDKRFVDGAALFQSLPRRPRRVGSLGARQVDQMNFAVRLQR